MTEVREAEALIAEHMRVWPREAVPLEHATDRVLREDVFAERDLPAFDRVTMDGIAIRYQDYEAGARSFRIAATQAAGVAPAAVEASGECIRVMTGAVCPIGADTIVPVERLTLGADVATISADATITPSQFIHARGSDRKSGSLVLAAGGRIGPPEMAVLASAGCARVSVARLPKVAVISTGDELVGIDEPVLPHQIRSSNGRAIAAALERHRLARVERVRLRDEETQLLERVHDLHADNDVLILSGGVSMGDFDFVPATLNKLGCELVFHRINQKPGRPMWFGVSAAGKPIFALPGNPVSTLVCVARYVAPAFEAALGLEDRRVERAVLSEAAADSPPKMTHFVPVRLSWTPSGTVSARPTRINTSGDFASLAGTDGIVELPPDSASRQPGATVSFYGW